MKFFNQKQTHYFTIEENKVGGTGFELVSYSMANARSKPKVISTEGKLIDEDTALNFLVAYSQKEGLTHGIHIAITDPKVARIRQGETTEGKDFVALSPEDVVLKAQEYQANVKAIRNFELNKAEAIVAAKLECSQGVDDLEAINDSLAPIISTGAEAAPCNATWEFDREAGYAVLLRSDNGKCLRFRKMTPDEEAETNLFDGDTEGSDPKDTKAE